MAPLHIFNNSFPGLTAYIDIIGFLKYLTFAVPSNAIAAAVASDSSFMATNFGNRSYSA
jgi:hypothetical protein